jgi:hypothetical protein
MARSDGDGGGGGEGDFLGASVCLNLENRSRRRLRRLSFWNSDKFFLLLFRLFFFFCRFIFMFLFYFSRIFSSSSCF